MERPFSMAPSNAARCSLRRRRRTLSSSSLLALLQLVVVAVALSSAGALAQVRSRDWFSDWFPCVEAETNLRKRNSLFAILFKRGHRTEIAGLSDGRFRSLSRLTRSLHSRSAPLPAPSLRLQHARYISKQLPDPAAGGGPISSLFRSLAGKGGGDAPSSPSPPSDVASASSVSSTPIGPSVSTDNALASGKTPPLARSDAFQSSADAGKLLGGGTFPETGDPTTGSQVPVPATLSSKAQTAAPADWVPPASGQLPPRDANYDAEASTLSAAQAKTNNLLNGVTVGAKAEAKKNEEGGGGEATEGGMTTSALAAAASDLRTTAPSPASAPALDATGTKSFKSAKPVQLAKLVAPAGPNSQASSWPNASMPQPAPGVVPTLRSQDPNIAALDKAEGVPPVPATSVLSDGSIAGGNANYGKQVAVTIAANLSYPGPGLKGEKVTVRLFFLVFLSFWRSSFFFFSRQERKENLTLCPPPFPKSHTNARTPQVCHFPSPTFQGTGADPYTVKPLFLPAPAADLLLGSTAGNGFDFAAPPPGSTVFGPGCVSYDYRCSFGYNGIPCSGHGVCQSTLPNSCLCANGWKSCSIPGSNGCETNTNRDVNNCGTVRICLAFVFFSLSASFAGSLCCREHGGAVLMLFSLATLRERVERQMKKLDLDLDIQET